MTNAPSLYLWPPLTIAFVITNGAPATTPGCAVTVLSTGSQPFITMSEPIVSTRTSGLPIRIFSRKSFCSPVMTPMITMSALTPTTTPPIAITLISDSSFDPRRLRRYRHAMPSSSRLIRGASWERG